MENDHPVAGVESSSPSSSSPPSTAEETSSSSTNNTDLPQPVAQKTVNSPVATAPLVPVRKSTRTSALKAVKMATAAVKPSVIKERASRKVIIIPNKNAAIIPPLMVAPKNKSPFTPVSKSVETTVKASIKPKSPTKVSANSLSETVAIRTETPQTIEEQVDSAAAMENKENNNAGEAEQNSKKEFKIGDRFMVQRSDKTFRKLNSFLICFV